MGSTHSTIGVTGNTRRTRSEAVCDTPFAAAVMTTVLSEVTDDVWTVKGVEVAPAGAVTEGGTVAALFPEVRVTRKPFAGAGPVSVTVPVERSPPVMVAG